MLDWMKRQVSRPIYTREAERDAPRPQGRVMSGKFDVGDAITLDQAMALSPEQLGKRVIPFLKISGG